MRTAAAKNGRGPASSRPVLDPPLPPKDRLQRSPNCGFIETDCPLNYTVSAERRCCEATAHHE